MTVNSSRHIAFRDDKLFWWCPQRTYWERFLERLSDEFYTPTSVGIHQQLRNNAFYPTYDPFNADALRALHEVDETYRTRILAYSVSARRVAFLHERREFARQLVDELDERLTQGRIRRMTAFTGGVQIVWQKTVWHGGVQCFGLTHALGNGNEGYAQISLSEVLLDDEIRLRDTVAHEFCHVAEMLIHRTKTEHGVIWWLWARGCEEKMAYRGIEIDEPARWLENFEYIWTCTGRCGQEIGSHFSVLSNVVEYTCTNCGGAMVRTNPVPRIPFQRADWIDYEVEV